MNKKTILVKEDINRGRFELIKESPSGHGVSVDKSLIERRYLNLAIYRYMQLPHLLNLLSSPHEFYVALVCFWLILFKKVPSYIGVK